MSRILSAETKAIVNSTAPALQQHGVAITQRMYERLFVDPAVKAMFDEAAQESGEQPRRLAAAILAYGGHSVGGTPSNAKDEQYRNGVQGHHLRRPMMPSSCHIHVKS